MSDQTVSDTPGRPSINDSVHQQLRDLSIGEEVGGARLELLSERIAGGILEAIQDSKAWHLMSDIELNLPRLSLPPDSVAFIRVGYSQPDPPRVRNSLNQTARRPGIVTTPRLQFFDGSDAGVLHAVADVGMGNQRSLGIPAQEGRVRYLYGVATLDKMTDCAKELADRASAMIADPRYR